ncbi:hypothetical protein BC828DRAFT_221852 [Blastocladiella britannica]|nr:hypothetical protein BC828DRAFT_221852 [Blastocladiella britannica]
MQQHAPASGTTKGRFRVRLHEFRATNLPAMDRNGRSDPYIKVNWDNFKSAKSSVEKETLNPTFDCFDLNFVYETQYLDRLSEKKLSIDVMDHDRFKADDPIGSCSVDLHTIAHGPKHYKLPLRDAQTNPKGMLYFTAEMDWLVDVTLTMQDLQISLGVTLPQLHDPLQLEIFPDPDPGKSIRTLPQHRDQHTGAVMWSQMPVLTFNSAFVPFRDGHVRFSLLSSRGVGRVAAGSIALTSLVSVRGATGGGGLHKVRFHLYPPHSPHAQGAVPDTTSPTTASAHAEVIATVDAVMQLRGAPPFGQRASGQMTELGIVDDQVHASSLMGSASSLHGAPSASSLHGAPSLSSMHTASPAGSFHRPYGIAPPPPPPHDPDSRRSSLTSSATTPPPPPPKQGGVSPGPFYPTAPMAAVPQMTGASNHGAPYHSLPVRNSNGALTDLAGYPVAGAYPVPPLPPAGAIPYPMASISMPMPFSPVGAPPTPYGGYPPPPAMYGYPPQPSPYYPGGGGVGVGYPPMGGMVAGGYPSAVPPHMTGVGGGGGFIYPTPTGNSGGSVPYSPGPGASPYGSPMTSTPGGEIPYGGYQPMPMHPQSTGYPPQPQQGYPQQQPPGAADSSAYLLSAAGSAAGAGFPGGAWGS